MTDSEQRIAIHRKPPYRNSGNDGNTQVSYFKDATAAFYSFKGDPVTVNF